MSGDVADAVEGGGHQRGRGLVDAGLGVGSLADPQRLLEQHVEGGPHGAGLLAAGQRVSGLAEDLGLADGHRVEPGGDLEEVGHRAVVVVDVEVGQEILGGAARAFDEQPGQLLDAAVEAVDVGVDLQAVAGRDDGGLRHVLSRCDVARELGGPLAVDGDALQQRYGRGPVGDADHEDAHAVAPRLSTWAPTLDLRCSW